MQVRWLEAFVSFLAFVDDPIMMDDKWISTLERIEELQKALDEKGFKLKPGSLKMMANKTAWDELSERIKTECSARWGIGEESWKVGGKIIVAGCETELVDNVTLLGVKLDTVGSSGTSVGNLVASQALV